MLVRFTWEKNNWVIENFKKNTVHKKIVVESNHKEMNMSAPFIGKNILNLCLLLTIFFI